MTDGLKNATTKATESTDDGGADPDVRDEVLAFNYALEYFKYHASQRYKSFQFFLIQLFLVPVAAIASNIVNSNSNELVIGLGCLVGLVMTTIFRILDIRNEQLVKVAEKRLIEIEATGLVCRILTPQATSNDSLETHPKFWLHSHRHIFDVVYSMAGFTFVCTLVYILAT